MSEDGKSRSGAKEPQYPFSLTSSLTIKAMDRLGITEEDIRPISFNEILKLGNNKAFAQKQFKVMTDRRNELIDLIVKERENIRKESNNEAKPDGLVTYAKMQTERNLKISEQKDETNKLILKRIAINEIRQKKKKEQFEERNRKVDTLTLAHTEKMNSLPVYTETYRVFVKREEPFDTKKEEEIKANMEKHIARREQVMKDEKKKLEEIQEVEKSKACKVFENSEQLLEKKREKTMKKIDSLEHNREMSEEQTLQRQKEAAERYEKVLKLGEEKRKKAEELVQAKTERAHAKLTARMKKSEEVKGQAMTEKQQKIQSEKERLERMTAAANVIFAQQTEKRENFRQFLKERDEKVDNLVQTFKETREENLLERRLNHDIKSTEVRRRARSRQAQAFNKLEKTLNRDSSMLPKAEEERTRSELSKAMIEEKYSEKRRILKETIKDLDGKTEEQQITIMMNAIGITREEAKELFDAAKRPI